MFVFCFHFCTLLSQISLPGGKCLISLHYKQSIIRILQWSSIAAGKGNLTPYSNHHRDILTHLLEMSQISPNQKPGICLRFLSENIASKAKDAFLNPSHPISQNPKYGQARKTCDIHEPGGLTRSCDAVPITTGLNGMYVLEVSKILRHRKPETCLTSSRPYEFIRPF